jgi:iron complex outermembrane recepter protein
MTSRLRTKAVLGAVLLALWSVGAAPAQAQERGTIQGTVIEGGTTRPLSGVQIVIEGTGTGTLTNAQGRFQLLNVPAGTHTLRAMMIGYATASRPVTVVAAQVARVDIQLDQAAVGLDEVVVTALGVERQRRDITYSIAQVSAEELTQAAPVSLASAMYGKTTGLQVAQGASGPTGGVSLQVRGVKSITGNNRPLVIVDGIPMQDRNTGYSTVDWEYNRDFGSGFNNINPNDIESVQVLKGASAAALYGAQAANGVVLIQTKRGRHTSGMGIEFSTSMTADRVANLPEMQNEFGVGLGWRNLITGPNDGEFLLNADGVPYAVLSSHSWGPRMRGQQVLWWDGQMRPFSPQPNNFRELWDPGYNQTTSVALSNATERARYRLGYTRGDWAGVFPGSSQDRNTLTLTGNLDISERLRTDISLNYFSHATVNPPPKWYWAFNFPRSTRTDLMREMYKTPEGYRLEPSDYPRLLGNDARMMEEFFWTGYERRLENNNDQLLGSIGANLAVTDWLDLRLKAGTDFTNIRREDHGPSTRPAGRGASGHYSVMQREDRINYGELMLTTRRRLTESLGIDVLVGAATTQGRVQETAVWTEGGLVVENWFSIGNSQNTPGRNAWRGMDRTDGVFGQASFSFRDYLTVTATGRNDWTSTLPPGANSYFYPSIGANLVFSDVVQLPSAISYGILRANFAEVGRGASRYQANNVYEYDNWEGITRNRFSTTVPPLALRPERKREIEVGMEMGFLNDRIGFDAAFYQERNIDQIINLGVAHSSGATNITVNNGEMRNTGFEMQLRGTPVTARNFQWNSIVNFSRNRNEVVRLAEGLESLVLQNVEDNLYIEARPGRPFGEIYGYNYRFAPDGQRIVAPGGLYAKDDQLTLVGNITPNFTAGFINTVRVRDFSLTGVVDLRMGGDIISLTNYYGYTTGRWPETLRGRDESLGGLPFWVGPGNTVMAVAKHPPPPGARIFHEGIILDGVQEVRDANGNVTYRPNDVLIPTETYYRTNFGWKGQGIYPEAISDNSFARVREVVLGYRVPGAMSARLGTQDLQLSLIGRNLGFLFKNVPNIDPESSLGTDASVQGYQNYHAYYPTTRSLGFGINARF